MLKYFLRQIYTYSFYISKLNDLKVIHDLYSQCLIQALSKMTLFFFSTEAVLVRIRRSFDTPYSILLRKKRYYTMMVLRILTIFRHLCIQDTVIFSTAARHTRRRSSTVRMPLKNRVNLMPDDVASR